MLSTQKKETRDVGINNNAERPIEWMGEAFKKYVRLQVRVRQMLRQFLHPRLDRSG
jgi:hypothetical protein